MKLALASDHGAFELKDVLINALKERSDISDIIDLGVNTTESVDYPDMADKLVNAIKAGQADKGILLCGTGIGISIRANRHKGIRAALVYDAFTAEMAKAHNNANVLCLGGRTTDADTAKKLVTIWLDTAFEGGRHQGRLDKLDA